MNLDRPLIMSCLLVIVFLCILAISLNQLFTAPSIHYEIDGVKYTERPNALTLGGLTDLGKIWRESPSYYLYNGAIILLAAGGLINCGYLIYELKSEENLKTRNCDAL